MYNVLGLCSVRVLFSLKTMAGQTMVIHFFILLFKNFLYFCKFCKHWATVTVLVVLPNALYLLVVDEKLFNNKCLELLF